jgi:hypothetical protein
MKSKIIYLGLASLGFSASLFATSISACKVHQVISFQSKEETIQNENKNEENCNINNDIFNPSSIIIVKKQTLEERIKEDQQITAYSESPAQYLSLEFTVEDKIEEYNQIIESTQSNEVLPLNYDIINQLSSDLKKANSNSFISSELKL